MATRPWPPRVIRQDGSPAPQSGELGGAPDPSAAPSSPAPTAPAPEAAARPPAAASGPSSAPARSTARGPAAPASAPPSSTRYGTARAEVERESVRVGNGTAPRAVETPPERNTSVTALQVRPARGVLQPVRDREQRGGEPANDTPPIENRSLARTEKQGEIFFVKHTMGEPVDPRLAMATNRDSARAASYRLLRQRLVEQGDPKVILVTSARNREGKTTSAANLALAYCEQGHSRVLLVEANFRSAALGEVFGFKPPRCFSVQLDRHRDKPTDPWVVVQVVPSDVHIVAIHPNCCPSCSRVLVAGAKFCGDCGRKVANEPLRLDRVTFAASIQRFRKAFDYIVIDGPSVLESADVNLIQDTADGIVMSARGRHTDARSLKRAMDQVAPAPVLGVALVDD